MTGDRARRIIAVALMTTRAGAPKPNILAADNPKAALLGASPGGCRRAHVERHGSRLS